MSIQLPLGSIMEWQRGETVCVPSEHNRAPVDVDYDRIKDSDRMHDATLREYFRADKRTWSTSWSELPAPSDQTVDGKAGAAEMEQFYRDTRGTFTLTIKHKDAGLDETVPVTFQSFSKTHSKRGAYDVWEVSVAMEEI